MPVDQPRFAGIHTPDGLHYVSQALDYRGFLVQRYYKGVGRPVRAQTSLPASGRLAGSYQETFARYVAHYVPVLHPGVLAATGFSYQDIWSRVQQYGEAIFDHPAYAGYCLRWGDNAHGYRVDSVAVPPLRGQHPPLHFSAQTRWPSQQLICVLESPLSDAHWMWQELFSYEALYQLPGLLPGRRTGFDGEQLAKAQHIVAANAYEWSWAQPYSVYAVTVQLAGKTAREWCFATAEEARVWYEQLPVRQRRETPLPAGAPRVTLRRWQQVADEVFDEVVVCRNNLLPGWEQKDLYLPDDRLAAVCAAGVSGHSLTELERPQPREVLTLAGLLDAQRDKEWGLTLTTIARRLDLSPAVLHRRAQHPDSWSMAELRRVAELTGCPVSELVELLEAQHAAASFAT